MKRRQVIAGFAGAWLAAPIRAAAQTTRKPVIGILFHSNPEPVFSQLRIALARLGYRTGETIELDLRVADGSEARLAELAVELVTRKVDAIFAFTTPAVFAAKAATGSIPVVMSSADPVGSGLVASLARPGGNITGMSLAVPQIAGAILGLLREALPGARRIGALVNVNDPFHRQLVEGIEAANRNVKLDLRVYGVTKPDEMEAAFAHMAGEKIDAAIVQPTLPREAAIALGFSHKIPTASPVSGYAAAGGFLSYAGKITETSAVIAAQIDLILRGANPAEMPVRQPSKFELVINLKTAGILGLEVPPLVLAQADEVIE